MRDVRCRDCRRKIGTSAGNHAGITCIRLACQVGIPKAMVNEDRDSVMESLERLIVPREIIADVTGVSTQRIGQILITRRRAA